MRSGRSIPPIDGPRPRRHWPAPAHDEGNRRASDRGRPQEGRTQPSIVARRAESKTKPWPSTHSSGSTKAGGYRPRDLADGPLGSSNAIGTVSSAGTAASTLTISGGGASRVFRVDKGAVATLSWMTIAGRDLRRRRRRSRRRQAHRGQLRGRRRHGLRKPGVYNTGSFFASDMPFSGDQADRGDRTTPASP